MRARESSTSPTAPRWKRAFDEAAAAYGRIDVVFANAGIGGGPGFLGLDGERRPESAFESISEERWHPVVDHHLTSVFWTIQAAVRHMKPNGGGRIIVTTSIAALKTEAVVGAPYMAAKAGAAHLVRQAALELARYNILVNAIAPGPFLTNISGGRLRDPAVRRHHERVTPLKRLADAGRDHGACAVPGLTVGEIHNRRADGHRRRSHVGVRRLKRKDRAVPIRKTTSRNQPARTRGCRCARQRRKPMYRYLKHVAVLAGLLPRSA